VHRIGHGFTREWYSGSEKQSSNGAFRGNNERLPLESESKVCVRCGAEKSLEEFVISNATPGGRAKHCKVCHAKRGRETWRKNASSSLKKFLTYRVTKTRNYTAVKTRGLPHTLVMKDVMEMFEEQNGLCAISGIPMTHDLDHTDTNVSIDRIDPNKGYVRSNVRLTTTRANLMRHTMDDSMLRWWARAILSKEDE